MINHIRTLLLNSINTGEAAPWERYMPKEFRPLELPWWLEDTRKTLVGEGEWFDRTYAVEVLLNVVNSPKYQFAQGWLDKRTTNPQLEPFYSTFTSNVQSFVQPDNMFAGLIFTGTDIDKPIVREWSVLAEDASTVVVRDLRDETAPTRTVPLKDGLVVLDDDITMSFNEPLLTSARWEVETVTRPQPSIVEYPEKLSKLGIGVRTKLFRVEVPGDAALATYTEWLKEQQPEDIVAAYVLAYTYQASKLIPPS